MTTPGGSGTGRVRYRVEVEFSRYFETREAAERFIEGREEWPSKMTLWEEHESDAGYWWRRGPVFPRKPTEEASL